VIRLRAALRAAALLAATFAVAACAPGYRGEPLSGPLDVSGPLLSEGQRSFARHCQQCHPGGQAGLAPAITPSPSIIRIQTRLGIGVMPAFSEERLPDAELDALIAYIMEKSAHGLAVRGP
jgi:mono/diheme cytochrome c family protein